MKRFIGSAFRAALIAASLLAAAAAAPAAADACVGRTLFIGHYDTPDQAVVANLLAVFIDLLKKA